MRAPLYFRYTGIEETSASEIPLEDLGRSLIGFDHVIKDLARVIRLNGVIEVKAASYHEGSLILDTILELKLELDQLPFETVDQLLDFLRLASDAAWHEALEIFSSIKDGLVSLNEYFKERPLNLALFAVLIPSLISYIRDRNRKRLLDDPKLAERLAKELQALIDKNVFSDALKPLLEETALSIEVSSDREFRKGSARIDQYNFQEYLSPDQQILPDLHDGHEYTLEGEITSLKSTRGDSLTFHFLDRGKEHNLDALPERDKSTKAYVSFYKERVKLTGTVERSSYYKKPKLHITDIALVQPSLFE